MSYTNTEDGLCLETSSPSSVNEYNVYEHMKDKCETDVSLNIRAKLCNDSTLDAKD